MNYKKINNKKDPTRCSIAQIGNKLVENCSNNNQCEYKNNIRECPGLDNDYMYGFLGDIGYDLSDTYSNNIYTDEENNLIKNQESESEKIVEKLENIGEETNIIPPYNNNIFLIISFGLLLLIFLIILVIIIINIVNRKK